MAKIVKIGTFNEQGFPIRWTVDTEGVEELEHVLGIINEKVYVNRVEIVEWTEERKRCITGGGLI